MAYTAKSTVKVFYELVKEGWEPTFGDIMEKFFPRDREFDQMRRSTLAKRVIQRVRRKLKKEDLYFYCVANKYKLLESSKDRLDVTNKLFQVTKGFATSTNHLLNDTMNAYPRLARNYLVSIQAKFNIISQLALGATTELNKVLEDENTKESEERV